MQTVSMKNSGTAYVTLISTTIAFTIAFAAWSLLGPLAPQLQKLYGLNDFQISVVTAVPVILGSLARIPVGIYSDRIGGRKMMLALLAFTIIPLLGITTANGLFGFIFWGFLLGMAGSTFAAGIPLGSSWFTANKQGLALGIVGMGSIGTAISSYFANDIAQTFGSWQSVFFVFAGVVALAAIFFFFTSKEAPRGDKPPQTFKSQMALLGREKLAWVFGLFYFLTFGSLVTFSLYMPKLFVDDYAFDVQTAANRAALFVIIATIIRPISGWLSDKVGGTNLLTITFVGTIAFASALAFIPTSVIPNFAFVGLAICAGLGNGAIFQLIPRYFAKDAGTVSGLVGAAGGLGGFFPQLAMGAIRTNTGSYTLGYLLLALVALLCLIIEFITLVRPAELKRSQPAI